MTSHEAGYFSDFDPADPLAGIDHARVCTEVLSQFTAEESVIDALRLEQEYQTGFDKRTYDNLASIGAYLLPPGANSNEPVHSAKFSTYFSGVLTALKVVDTMTASIGIDPAVFRRTWYDNGFVMVIDINSSIFDDKTKLEKYDAIGDGVIANGDEFLRMMKPEYQELVDTVSDNHTVLTDPHIFKAAYGYVLGYAMDAMAKHLREEEFRKSTQSIDIDKSLEHFVEEPIPVQFIRDDDIADEVDNMVFYSEDMDTEKLLGEQIEYLMSEDSELVETLDTLALLQYPNELGSGALDQNGEAFFMGTMLGLVFGERHCKALDIEFGLANRRWRKNGVHARINRLDFLPEGRIAEVDRKVMNTLLATELSPVMHGLLDKISHRLDHDEDESIAFKNGLHYMLESHKKTIRECVDAKIAQRVRLATVSLDDELLKLLGE